MIRPNHPLPDDPPQAAPRHTRIGMTTYFC
jgi:hypothetical protein